MTAARAGGVVRKVHGGAVCVALQLRFLCVCSTHEQFPAPFVRGTEKIQSKQLATPLALLTDFQKTFETLPDILRKPDHHLHTLQSKESAQMMVRFFG